jgi:predicted nuclease with TOPRIM domain
MERLQIELDDLKEDYDELNNRHTGLQENNEELRDKHDDLKGGIKKLQKELNEHKAENARLRLRDC